MLAEMLYCPPDLPIALVALAPATSERALVPPEQMDVGVTSVGAEELV